MIQLTYCSCNKPNVMSFMGFSSHASINIFDAHFETYYKCQMEMEKKWGGDLLFRKISFYVRLRWFLPLSKNSYCVKLEMETAQLCRSEYLSAGSASQNKQ